MIVTHCKLDLFKVLDIKVLFVCFVRQKLFAVHLNFNNGISHLQQVKEVRTCVSHSFDSLIAHLGLLHGGKFIR